MSKILADCNKEFIGMGLMEVEGSFSGGADVAKQRAKSRLDEFVKEHPNSQM